MPRDLFFLYSFIQLTDITVVVSEKLLDLWIHRIIKTDQNKTGSYESEVESGPLIRWY